jgi:hypothetical protein
MTRGGHGLLKVLLGPTTPEKALKPFQGWLLAGHQASDPLLPLWTPHDVRIWFKVDSRIRQMVSGDENIKLRTVRGVRRWYSKGVEDNHRPPTFPEPTTHETPVRQFMGWPP